MLYTIRILPHEDHEDLTGSAHRWRLHSRGDRSERPGRSLPYTCSCGSLPPSIRRHPCERRQRFWQQPYPSSSHTLRSRGSGPHKSLANSTAPSTLVPVPRLRPCIALGISQLRQLPRPRLLLSRSCYPRKHLRKLPNPLSCCPSHSAPLTATLLARQLQAQPRLQGQQ